MKKDLINIFKDSMQNIKTNIYILSSCTVILMLISGIVVFETRKVELIKFIEYNLGFDQVLPAEESKFIIGLKNATGDFSFRIVSPNSNSDISEIICSRNNCFILDFSKLAMNVSFPIFVIIIILAAFLFSLEFIQKKKMLNFLNEISLLQNILEGKAVDLDKVSSQELLVLLKNIETNKLLEDEKVKVDLKSNINRQIAHDIRSPLEALKSVTAHIDDLDHTSKQIINNSIGRITDIANGLLKASKKESIEFDEVNLRILLEDIVSDKKIEHGIKIHYNPSLEYRESFITGNESSLYRSISNVLNNAYEAQDPGSVRIEVKLDDSSDGVLLSINDFGMGMTPELIEKALAGGTTTKEAGHGLGLSFSKKTIEDHRGTLIVSSNGNDGTKVEVLLPSIKAPKWFTDVIDIESDVSEVVCVDDDPSFLELYKEKLKDIAIPVTTYSEKNIENVILTLNTQFYFDFDFGNNNTGLDFIIKNDLCSQSTLVTSMYQDEDIQNQCVDHGIKILPKQIFNFSKVVTNTRREIVDTDHKVRIVFIDDDYLMHMSWEVEARRKGIQLDCFHTVDDFLIKVNEYDLNTKIFVDSNLKDGIRGEQESIKIFEFGFTEIYLATGYSASDIDKPEWIKEIVGKRANF
jgi:signal transduction histidine kinase